MTSWVYFHTTEIIKTFPSLKSLTFLTFQKIWRTCSRRIFSLTLLFAFCLSTDSSEAASLHRTMRYFRAKLKFTCMKGGRAPGYLFLPTQFQKCSTSVPLIGQKSIFLANQRDGVRTLHRISAHGVFRSSSKAMPGNTASSCRGAS